MMNFMPKNRKKICVLQAPKVYWTLSPENRSALRFPKIVNYKIWVLNATRRLRAQTYEPKAKEIYAQKDPHTRKELLCSCTEKSTAHCKP